MTSDVEISKFMSLVLRHAPEKLGISLDQNGWTDFADFSRKICEKFKITNEMLLRLIEENPKKRFTLENGRIRAAQGHSVEVELALEPAMPPAILFHGTNDEAWQIIELEGLKPMERGHVHLSADIETADRVAKRRKGPHILLKVDCSAMSQQGYTFFQADNGVWLTQTVPMVFLSPVSETA